MAKDVAALVKKDHAAIRMTMARLIQASRNERPAILNDLEHQLNVHRALHEETLHPQLRASASPARQRTLLEFEEEHRVLNELLSTFKGLEPTSPEYEAKCAVLNALGKQHLSNEAKNLLRASGMSAAQRTRLAQELAERRRVLERNYEIVMGTPPRVLAPSLGLRPTFGRRLFEARTRLLGAERPRRPA